MCYSCDIPACAAFEGDFSSSLITTVIMSTLIIHKIIVHIITLPSQRGKTSQVILDNLLNQVSTCWCLFITISHPSLTHYLLKISPQKRRIFPRSFLRISKEGLNVLYFRVTFQVMQLSVSSKPSPSLRDTT